MGVANTKDVRELKAQSALLRTKIRLRAGSPPESVLETLQCFEKGAELMSY